VTFTTAETGFAPQLIEKDYFCTVILQHLAMNVPELIFKGGTCLAKVHLGFYRLSEDLDFSIPMPVHATRAQRSRLAAGPKAVVARIAGTLPGIRAVAPLAGANDSSQYSTVIRYSSPLGRREDTVKIEVALREPLLTEVVTGEAKTLLLDPVSGSPLVPAIRLPCLSREEAMAEKLRAALTRREAAIRDFYDIDHAVRRLGVRVQSSEMVRLLRQKLAVPGNEPVDISARRLAILTPQRESQLKPVLRDRDLAEFDLDRAFTIVTEVAGMLGEPP